MKLDPRKGSERILSASLQVTEVSRETFENQFRLKIGVLVQFGEKTIERLFHFPIDMEQEALESELVKIKQSIAEDELSAEKAVDEQEEIEKVEQLAEELTSKTF